MLYTPGQAGSFGRSKPAYRKVGVRRQSSDCRPQTTWDSRPRLSGGVKLRAFLTNQFSNRALYDSRRFAPGRRSSVTFPVASWLQLDASGGGVVDRSIRHSWNWGTGRLRTGAVSVANGA